MLDRPGIKLLLLLCACLGVYLAGNSSVPLWDRDEPRFAQTSRQMLQSGDWVVPRLYDSVRTAKPPLIYWAQAASMMLIGDEGSSGVFAARLPSSIAMTLTLTILAAALWRHAGPERALWTVLILSTSAMVLLAAKTGLTDSVLLLFMTAAQLCLYVVWRGRGSWGITVIMSVAIALALLTKGPVAVGIQAMTIVGMVLLRFSLRWDGEKPAAHGFDKQCNVGSDRPQFSGLTCEARAAVLEYSGPRPASGAAKQWRVSGVSIARFFVGLLIVLAIGFPWVILVERRHPGFISTALNHEIKDRAASGLEGHKGPPGYYLASIWPTFLPWSLVLPLALVMGWKNRREPVVRFALAAVAGPWIMFEIVQTKLPHYLLPCFPPLAFLAADAIVRCLRARGPLGIAPLAASRIRTNDAADPIGGLRVEKDGESGGAALLICDAASGGGRPSGTTTAPSTSTPDRISQPFEDRGFFAAVIAWSGIAVLLGLAPWMAATWFRPLPWAVMALITLCAVAYAVAITHLFHQRRPAAALATMGAGMLGLALVLFGLYLPTAPFLRLSIDAGGVLRDHGVTGPRQAIMLDYKEPSLAFYQGGSIREETSVVASDKVLDNSPAWMVMTNEVYNAKGTNRSRLQIIARFRGLDLSDRLRVVEVMVVRKSSS